MKRAELEGTAVAYALFIMQQMDVRELNARILAEHGASALVRIKKRAWQHVHANAAQDTNDSASHGPDARSDTDTTDARGTKTSS